MSATGHTDMILIWVSMHIIIMDWIGFSKLDPFWAGASLF